MPMKASERRGLSKSERLLLAPVGERASGILIINKHLEPNTFNRANHVILLNKVIDVASHQPDRIKWRRRRGRRSIIDCYSRRCTKVYISGRFRWSRKRAILVDIFKSINFLNTFHQFSAVFASFLMDFKVSLGDPISPLRRCASMRLYTMDITAALAVSPAGMNFPDRRNFFPMI